jgi:hypothetical integral membrane protein (TIGR02206 family)
MTRAAGRRLLFSRSESPVAYATMVGLTCVVAVVGCVEARLRPGRWAVWAARLLALFLCGIASLWLFTSLDPGPWSLATGLPLNLCDTAVFLAAAACWWRSRLLVELVYFWGLGGTLQAIITPELDVGFPHLLYLQYMLGHLGVVLAALFLVAGLGLAPRRHAVARAFGITAAFTLLVGLVDARTGADYMFLRRPPPTWSLLRVFGPWPWYLLTAAGMGIAILVVLDALFWGRRRPGPRTSRWPRLQARRRRRLSSPVRPAGGPPPPGTGRPQPVGR